MVWGIRGVRSGASAASGFVSGACVWDVRSIWFGASGALGASNLVSGASGASGLGRLGFSGELGFFYMNLDYVIFSDVRSERSIFELSLREDACKRSSGRSRSYKEMIDSKESTSGADLSAIAR